MYTPTILLALAAQAVAQTSTYTGVATPPSSAASSPSALNSVSVLAVLATALPTSLLDLAISMPAAASSMIASEFAAGSTPAWFLGLPSDIQTYLVPITTIKQAPAGFLSLLPTAATNLQTLTYQPLPTAVPRNSSMTYGNGTLLAHNGTMVASNGTMVAGNGTAAGMATMRNSSASRTGTGVFGMSSHAMTSTMGRSSSAAVAAPSSSTSTGMAAVMTVPAVLGAGFAGVMGVVGLLVL